jgi:Protein of unknown function (DUF3592)
LRKKELKRILSELEDLGNYVDSPEYEDRKQQFLDNEKPRILKTEYGESLAKSIEELLEIEAVEKAHDTLERLPVGVGSGHYIPAVIFFVFGAASLFYGIRDFKNAKASVNWPTTTGVVTMSEAQRRESSTTSNTSTGTSRSTSVYYVAYIKYEYNVSGKIYSSDRYSYKVFNFSHRDEAEQMAKRFPPGKKVEVHYKPFDPQTAVLLKGTGKFSYVPLIVGVVCMIIFGYFAIKLATALLRSMQ